MNLICAAWNEMNKYNYFPEWKATLYHYSLLKKKTSNPSICELEIPYLDQLNFVFKAALYAPS